MAQARPSGAGRNSAKDRSSRRRYFIQQRGSDGEIHGSQRCGSRMIQCSGRRRLHALVDHGARRWVGGTSSGARYRGLLATDQSCRQGADSLARGTGETSANTTRLVAVRGVVYELAFTSWYGDYGEQKDGPRYHAGGGGDIVVSRRPGAGDRSALRMGKRLERS